ncbi:hypothetical protein EMIT048CA2_130027 [Pseudomonas chlororaphis]
MRRRGFVYVAPVAAAEHREAAIDREAGAALGRAGGPATSVARTIAAFGSGYIDCVTGLQGESGQKKAPHAGR